MKNNFDMSSTGTNIECLVFYNLDITRYFFKENFQSIKRAEKLYYYIENGNVPGPDEIEFLVKGTIEAKINALRDNYSDEILNTWSEYDLDSMIKEDFEINLKNFADENFPDISGLEFVPSKKLITVSVSGYSQGDYAKVIYCPDDLEKAWGNAPDEKKLTKIFNNLFWDAPIYGQFIINGTEHNIQDMPDFEEYEFNREEFCAWVAKESGVDIEKLLPLCPQYPDS